MTTHISNDLKTNRKSSGILLTGYVKLKMMIMLNGIFKKKFAIINNSLCSMSQTSVIKI